LTFLNSIGYNFEYSKIQGDYNMKKTLLLSVVASTMIMAGGDIAPVEPVVEAPAVKVADAAKVAGSVKVFYNTNDTGNNSLFNKNGAAADAYGDVKYSREVMDNITFNVGMAYITTLGLENDLVSATWAGHGANNVVGDVVWINEANVAVTLGNSLVKVGRQSLDTPFFYSENWNIASNTFDAALFANSDLPDTTLVAAWVGRGNGAAITTVDLKNENFAGGHAEFGGKAAYALAAVNSSLPDTTLQAWYYGITSTATAYWLQADTKVAGLSLGAQYAGTKLTSSSVKTKAYAVKAGYGMDGLNAHVAYSKRDNTANGINISNIATEHTKGSESKLYTESFWNYGYVGAQDAATIAAGASYDLGGATLGAQYTTVNTGLANSAGDLTEIAVTASTKVGPINANLAYVNAKKDGNSADNTVVIMLSLPYSL